MSNVIALPTLPADKLVEEYVGLRDALKIADETFSAWRQDNYGKRMDEIEAQLMGLLNSIGSDSLKTANGTAYRAVATSVTVANASEFQRYVIGGEHWGLLDLRANKTAVKDFLEENKILPPGLNMSTAYKLNIRRA
jgi:hypothetical protein